MTDVKMVVVDGVRYRPEDAPKRASEVKVSTPEPKARKAVSNKAAEPSEDKE